MGIKVTAKLGSPIFRQGALRQAVMAVVNQTALGVEAGLKLRIKQGPKTGRTYRRTSIKRAVGAKRAQEFRQIGLRQSRLKPGSFVIGYALHRASAPGESPADDTGFLANSIQATPAQDAGDSVRASVRVGAKYGRRLEQELGRPYVKPTVESARPQFRADVQSAVNSLT